MKLVLVSAAIIALIVSPSLARDTKAWVEQSVGQEVFSLKNTPVGRIDRYIEVHGAPGVLIKGSDAFGGRTLIMPAEDLTPRAAGGLLLMLTDKSVAHMPPYQPGRLPWW